MSRLENIREELYRRKPHEPPPRRGVFPRAEPEVEVPRSWREPEPEEPALLVRAQLAAFRQRRIGFRMLFGAGVLALVGIAAVIGYTVFFAGKTVTFSILGPDQVTAGEASVFIVRVQNRGGARITDASVTVTLPEGSLFSDQPSPPLGPVREKLDLEDIPVGGVVEKEIRARLVGAVGIPRTISGILLFRPENIQSKLTREAEFTTTVIRVPLAVSVDAPGRISSGQEVTVAIGVDSELSSPLPDMFLGVDAPSGFTLSSTNPPLATGADLRWPLASLLPGTSQKITIRGTLKGDPEEVKTFHLQLGRYDARSDTWLLLTETSAGPTIASPFLFVQTTLGGNRTGSLAPGSRVEGSVFFKNNLPQRIENLTITLTFPEKLVELETVRAEHGFYDVTQRALIWNPASETRLRELDPGAEGTVGFSLTLKSVLPIQKFSDKNFTFPVVTAIASASTPPEYRGVSLDFRDTASFKIESRLTLAASMSYYGALPPNTGPLPPRVRYTTTYTVLWQLGSGGNDLRDVDVRAVLAGGVEWRGEEVASIGAVSFNTASHEVVWHIPQLAAGTGVLRPLASATFTVALTPAENQLGSVPTVVGDVTASGQDTFTDTTQTASAQGLTTEIRSDPESNSKEWQVAR